MLKESAVIEAQSNHEKHTEASQDNVEVDPELPENADTTFNRAANVLSEDRREVIIVKLGGSAITDKSKLEILKPEQLKACSEQIKLISRENDGISFILVHGAGSFGHFTARQYKLSSGGEVESWLQGVSETRRSVIRLNRLVTEAMEEQAIPVATLSPFVFFTYSDGKLKNHSAYFSRQVTDLLRAGFVPISHGDVVLDDVRRCGIMSGDKVIEILCAENSNNNDNNVLRPARVVFLTDVAGVYTAPPTEPNAHLIPNIIVEADGSFTLPIFGEALHPDVTGGMRGKLLEAVNIATRGIPVYIVECGSKAALAAMRGEEPDICTKIAMR